MQFFQTPNIEFISKRRPAYFLSAALIVIGIASLILRGGPNLGIDFKGGTSIILQFEDEITTGIIREALNDVDVLGSPEIKSLGTGNEFLIYIEQQPEMTASETAKKVEEVITSKLADRPYEIRKIDNVGPRIGNELRRATILAIIFALFLILIYIGWRFELVFAFGAIAALFHDVLIIFGIFCLLNVEISLKEIAAFLTIVGYSLNDTIVVYDRIRENLKMMRNEDLSSIMNKSINQCLSRTIVTSLTTFVVVLVLFLFGGQVIKGFALAMLLGVLVGTYSSIFVASPVVLEWQSRHGGKRQLKMVKKKKN